MTEYKISSYKVTISRCPHCDVPVLIEEESYSNKKSAIASAINSFQHHIKNKCPLRMQINKKKKTTLSIMITSKSQTRTMTEWETDKVLV